MRLNSTTKYQIFFQRRDFTCTFAFVANQLLNTGITFFLNTMVHAIIIHSFSDINLTHFDHLNIGHSDRL